MRRFVLSLVAATSLLGGCGDMNEPATEFTPAADRLATAGNDSIPPLAPAVPPRDTLATRPTLPAAGALLPVPLRPIEPPGSASASSLSGTVVLRPQGGATLASITLTGAASGATYRGEVRQGRCDHLAAHVESLLDVSADVAGRGRAAAVLPLPVDSLTAAPHVVVYGRGGRPEVCGEITAPPASAPAGESVP